MRPGDKIQIVHRPSPFIPRDYRDCTGIIKEIGEYKVFVLLTIFDHLYYVPLHPKDFFVIENKEEKCSP